MPSRTEVSIGFRPRIDQNLESGVEPEKWVHSACALCSVGCGLEIAVKDNHIVGVRGDYRNPINYGHLGPKGENQWHASSSKQRGTTPLIRDPSGKLVPASWDEAMSLFVSKFKEALARGPQSVANYNSGQLLLEEYYVLGKFWSVGVNSPNIDANTRLCTATTAASLVANFGADGPPGSYADVDATQLIVCFGYNPAEQQTVLWERMLAAKQNNGAKIIVVDPRKTPSVLQGADLHLQIKSGTNVALMNGLIHLLIKNGWIDQNYIRKHTSGFDKLKSSVEKYPPEVVAEICEIPVEDLQKAAEWIGTIDRVFSCVLQGFYQSVDATGASSLVNSMHLIMGKIGKPGSAPMQMAGQPSSMSNREAGRDTEYPGYRNAHNVSHMAELSKLWKVSPDSWKPSIATDITTMFEKIDYGDIDLLWVIGTNPLVSMPDYNRSKRILEKVFLVVQDPFIDAETVEHADIYLPAAMWGEKTGCMTNAERSVNLLLKAVDPPGEARSDFDIFMDFSERMGFKDMYGKPLCNFTGPEDAFNEWRKVSKGRPCDYSGMSYKLIMKMGSVRWPCNSKYPQGAERLYEDNKFWTSIDDCESYGLGLKTGVPITRDEYVKIDPHGKAFLKPVEWQPPGEPPNQDYPFALNTGRIVYHWHTRTKTKRAPALQDRAPEAYVEIHPSDARKHGIDTGDLVSVDSAKGHWEGIAMVVDTVKPGNLFIPFHYGTHKEAANLHTGYSRDPVSQQPHQKNSRVQLSKLASGQAEPWLTKRREELIKPTIPYAAMEIGGTVNLEAPTMTTPFSKERRTMRKRSTTRAPTKR